MHKCLRICLPVVCVFVAPSPAHTPTGLCFSGNLMLPHAYWSVSSWHPHVATRLLVCVFVAPSLGHTPTGLCFRDTLTWLHAY